ncbi:MAG: GTPase [Promethearchaeia archaeon]
MDKNKYLLIMGNSNVGKSSITRLLLPHPKRFKGKSGKSPGSTLQIKPIFQQEMPYKIVDLPGFGYMRHSSRRREEHLKKQIVVHIEKKHQRYFLALVVINILRIEDELEKYHYLNQETIPLSFELISFLREFHIPLLILINKIDKLNNYHIRRKIRLIVNTAAQYGLNLLHFDDYHHEEEIIPYLEFSALNKTNLGKLNKEIHYRLSQD